jgi:hypothetical protein
MVSKSFFGMSGSIEEKISLGDDVHNSPNTNWGRGGLLWWGCFTIPRGLLIGFDVGFWGSLFYL